VNKLKNIVRIQKCNKDCVSLYLLMKLLDFEFKTVLMVCVCVCVCTLKFHVQDN